jgi:hypothetical protein
MKPQSCLLIIFILTTSINKLSAQPVPPRHRYHNYLTVGVSPIAMCLGDVGGDPDEQLQWKAGKPTYAFWVGFRRWHISRFGYRIHAAVGKYAGADNKNKIARNYRFSSDVLEAHLTPEYILFGRPFNSSESKHYLSVFAGVGIAHSHTSFEGDTRSSDKLKLNESALSIPFGLSYQYSIDPQLNLGAELSWRFFTSDFIDGIQTLFSKSDDLLANFTLTLSYQLPGNSNRRSNSMRYPCKCNWY